MGNREEEKNAYGDINMAVPMTYPSIEYVV